MALTTGIALRDPRTGREFSEVLAGINEVAGRLDGGLDRSARIVSAEFFRYMKRVAQALFRKHSQAYPGGTTSNTLSTRTGAGIAGIVRGVRSTGSPVVLDSVAVTMAIPGSMAIHEDGAVIRQRPGGPLLTVPLPDALDERGVPLRLRARDWENTFVARSRRGNLIIFQRRGRRIVPLYVLKTSVVIPPRLGAEEEIQRGLSRFETRILRKMEEAIL